VDRGDDDIRAGEDVVDPDQRWHGDIGRDQVMSRVSPRTAAPSTRQGLEDGAKPTIALRGVEAPHPEQQVRILARATEIHDLEAALIGADLRK